MSARVTIYAVAERAGVSISTVSLAINQPHRVQPATRARVLAAAADLGYRTGASRRDSHQLRVAVAAPFSSYPSYLRRLTGVLGQARGAQIVVEDLGSANLVEHPFLEGLPFRDEVDGTILMGVPLTAAATRQIERARAPVVLVDVAPRWGRRHRLASVLVDDELAGLMVAEHLIARGHRSIGFLNEGQVSFEYESAGMLRARGLLSARLTEPKPRAQEVLPQLLPRHATDPLCRLDLHDLSLVAGRIEPDPVALGVTAIVATHDELAARALGACEFPVVGFDDGPLAEALDLTTVRQPLEQTGAAAVDLLRTRLGDPEAPVSSVLLQPELVVRGSSRR